jgi:hypothetical protein
VGWRDCSHWLNIALGSGRLKRVRSRIARVFSHAPSLCCVCRKSSGSQVVGSIFDSVTGQEGCGLSFFEKGFV